MTTETVARDAATMLSMARGADGGLEPLRTPIPEPGPTEVRIKASVIGLNPVDRKTVAGRGVSSMSNLHYSSTKAAILGLTRKLAYEEGPNGIAVNSVCPGTTFTERVETRFRALDDAEQARRMDEIPLRRAARPDEIAACILFLASDDASYVTGAALDVNGGSFMS